MKKNNKRMLVAVLAMAMALSMTACAEEPAEDTSSSEPESSVSEQVSEPESSDLEVEDGTSSDAESESETSEPAADASSSAVDTGSSTASQPAADTTTSQPASDQGGSQAETQQPAASSQANTSSQTQAKAPATTQTSNTSSGSGPMAGYSIEVYDWGTPAASCLGESYNGKAGYVLRDASSNVVGMVPSDVVTQLLRANGLGMAESDVQFSWFVNAFNEFRGIESSNGSSASSSGSNSSGSGSSSEYDEDEYRSELFRLINDARKDEGLEPLNENSTAMEFAQIRAEELAEKFSHIRPDGSTMTYSHYNFAEIIAKGSKTPKDAVKLWLDSSGHRAAIMADYSSYGNYMGVGVYRDGGISYWVVEFVGWDANA